MEDGLNLLNTLLERDRKEQETILAEEKQVNQQLETLNQLIGKAEEQEKARKDLALAFAEQKQNNEALKPLQEAYELEEKGKPETDVLSGKLSVLRNELQEYERIAGKEKEIAAAEVSWKERNGAIGSIRDANNAKI